jgi:predicted SAM-dependent methyltransferase
MTLRLNLGCGDRYAPGWINVDYGSPHPKDLEVDLTGELPWGSGTVGMVYAGHLLEHLHLDDCRALLTRLRPLMKLGGVIMLVGPDVDRAQRMIDDGAGLAEMYGATMDSLRYGAGRWSGDVHMWECTEEQLVSLLEETGWMSITTQDIADVAQTWPVADSRPQWQCAVGAIAA